MNAIDLMVEEHRVIKRGLGIIRKICIAIVNGAEVPIDDFNDIISFIRNYADKHHHSKEEEILFKKMIEELGENKVSGPLSGMYIEHDLGRLFVGNLEAAINKVKAGEMDSRVDVIANGIAYTDLLNRHIEKEDNALYNFARRSLSSEALKDLQEKCEVVENNASEKKLQDTYIGTIEKLERKWS